MALRYRRRRSRVGDWRRWRWRWRWRTLYVCAELAPDGCPAIMVERMTEAFASYHRRPRSASAANALRQLREKVATELDLAELMTFQFPLEAAERAERLERLAVEAGDEHLELRALLVRADMQSRQGRSVAAGRLLRSVNRWATEHEDQYLLARSHRLLGSFFGSLGDDVAFLEHALKGVQLLAPEVRPALRADHLSALGMAQAHLGVFEEGRRSYSEAETLVQRLGDGYRHVLIVNNQAYLEYLAGDHQRALKAIGRLEDLARQHGIELVSRCLHTIARVYLELGRLVEAEGVLQKALGSDEAGEFTEGYGEAECLLSLAEAQRRGGALANTDATLKRCREVCREHSLHGILPRVRQEQAELYAAQGRMAEAFAEFREFHRDAQQRVSEAHLARAQTLQIVYDYEQTRRTSELMQDMAFRDPLTNLYNRRYLDSQLPTMLGTSAQASEVISVAFIDLDHFKRINDTLSHAVGDRVLCQISDLLVEAAPLPAFVARMGGEEFLVVLPGFDHETAVERCLALQHWIRTFDWTPLTEDIPVRASIGLVTAPAGTSAQAQLLLEADRNVYAAKSNGRDQTVATERT